MMDSDPVERPMRIRPYTETLPAWAMTAAIVALAAYTNLIPVRAQDDTARPPIITVIGKCVKGGVATAIGVARCSSGVWEICSPPDKRHQHPFWDYDPDILCLPRDDDLPKDRK